MIDLRPSRSSGSSATASVELNRQNSLSSNYSSYTTGLSSISEDTCPSSSQPGYNHRLEAARRAFASYKNGVGRESHPAEKTTSAEGISTAKSIISNTSASAKKEGGKVAGKVICKFRKIITVVDEKMEKHIGDIEASSGFISSVTFPVGPSGTSGTLNEKSPWCLTEYLSTPDPPQYDHVVSENGVNILAVDGVGDMVVKKYVDESTAIHDDLPLTTPETPLLPSFEAPKIEDEPRSKRYGLLGVSKLVEQTIHQNMPDHSEYSTRALDSETGGERDQSRQCNELGICDRLEQRDIRPVSNTDILIEENNGARSSLESTTEKLHSHHEQASGKAPAMRELDSAVAGLMDQRNKWEEFQYHRSHPETSDRKESTAKITRRRQLSWDIKEIDASIDEGMIVFKLRGYNSSRHADFF